MKNIWIVFVFTSMVVEAQNDTVNIADNLYAFGNYSKAIAEYKKHSNQSEVYQKIAKSYMAIGNYDEALFYYKESVKANPDQSVIKYEYAKLLSKTKHYNEASKLFNELVYYDYKNPNFHYELGLILEHLKDSTAMNRFRSAYDLDQTHQKAIFKIAKHYLVKRKHEIAERYINKGLESYANNLELISLKAQNYYFAHDYKNSAVWFEKLIELGESSEFIHEKLSLCYDQEYEFEKALEQRLIALRFNPQNATSMFVIGGYYQRLDDYENAEKYIRRAIVLLDMPLDKEYQKLGTVLNQQKKHKEAIDAFKLALKENPKNMSVPYFLVLTKDKYYEDLDTRIQLFVDFKKKYPKSAFIPFADKRLNELKEAQFLKQD